MVTPFHFLHIIFHLMNIFIVFPEVLKRFMVFSIILKQNSIMITPSASWKQSQERNIFSFHTWYFFHFSYICIGLFVCIYLSIYLSIYNRLPRWFSGKESTCQFKKHKRHVFNPGSGRSSGIGNGNPLQYFCLEYSMDRGAW